MLRFWVISPFRIVCVESPAVCCRSDFSKILSGFVEIGACWETYGLVRSPRMIYEPSGEILQTGAPSREIPSDDTASF